jgi:iron(III) transport system ATP-binding protein
MTHLRVLNSQKSAPLLTIRGVSKAFGHYNALRSIDLDVYEGELLTFLGPSGCGKSTLLRIIMGLERQSAGSIHHAGSDISGLSAAERGFGILFQSYALFPNLTVRGNVAYGLRSRGREANARVAEMLEMVGLPDVGEKYPSQLSGGQQQRVALARVLAPRPRLLLLDEPLSALDAKVRVHLREQIKDLQGRLGLTTIMVTHDQEEALAMANRIVVMNQGGVEQIGSPDDIYRHPTSLFVADFVGKMNVIAGRVRSGLFQPDGASRALALPAASWNGIAQLCIRPEDIEVSMSPPEASSASATATVSSVEFLGPFTRLNLRVADWGGVALNVDVAARQMRGLNLAQGESVTVALDPSRLQLIGVD